MRKKLIIILFLLPFLGFSQYNDFQIWSSLNVGYKLNKKSEFNIEQSLRTFQNSTNWRVVFTDISYYRNINKHFSFGVGYRFSFKNRLDYYLTANRIYLRIKAKKKINKFTLSYRLGLQAEYLGINQRDKWQTPGMYNRHLVKVKYKLFDKVKVYLSSEVYLLMEESIYFSDKYRFTGGFIYAFNKKNAINIFYRYQKEQFIVLTNTYILGVSYKYNL